MPTFMCLILSANFQESLFQISNTNLPSLVHDEQGRETNANCLPKVMVTLRNTALAELSENPIVIVIRRRCSGGMCFPISNPPPIPRLASSTCCSSRYTEAKDFSGHINDCIVHMFWRCVVITLALLQQIICKGENVFA